MVILTIIVLSAALTQTRGKKNSELTCTIIYENETSVHQYEKLEDEFPYSIKQENLNNAELIQ